MVQANLKKIVVICGPTAVGKTAVATGLAQQFEGEIINADSGQVWRGLNIGTAKPTPAACQIIPHHVIDVVNPDEHFDASAYLRLADEAIWQIISRHKNAFVVGGTGMYLRMLVHGLCDAPPRDPDLRAELEKKIDAHGIERLHELLKKNDPVSASVVHPRDRARIIRALEIFESTGVPASEFYKRHQFIIQRYDAIKIGLDLPRKELYQKIDERVDNMFNQGWIEEVKGLMTHYTINQQAFAAIGYRELMSHLKGETSFDVARDLIKRNSRRYAKRQLTWFRADHEIHWFHPSQLSEIAAIIRRFLGSN